MTVNLLQTLSLISFIAAAVFFLVAIALFFLLDVPKLYGEISGNTAKKAIAEIKERNDVKKPTKQKSRTKPTKTEASDVPTVTEKLAPQFSSGATTVLNSENNETTVLSVASQETTLLVNNGYGSQETTLLVNNDYSAQETTLLAAETSPAQPIDVDNNFTIDVEMVFTDSAEIIE